MATSVFCLASSESNAAEIVRRLKAASFAENDISVLFPDKSGTRDFAAEHHTKAPEGAVAGAGTGGVLGGTVGLLAGIGALAIPGVGPFIAAGPILAALSGAAMGAAVGGLTGGLIGLGIPEYEAKRYEGKIREGGVLVSVHCPTGDHATTAKKIMTECGATDIASGSEKSPPGAARSADARDRATAPATHSTAGVARATEPPRRV